MKTRLSVVGWVFLLMMIVSYCGYSFIELFHIQDNMLRNGLGTILLGLPAVVFLLLQDKPNKQKVRFHWLSFKTIVLLIIIAIALELVTIEINVATSFIFSSYTVDIISNDVSSSTFLTSLICMAVLPAIFEELSFRGAFFQEYRDAYGAWAGAVFSGLLFGLYHLNMRQFIYAFLCGIFFAFLIEATDSIASSMLMHFLLNAISCVAIYITSKFPEEAVEEITAEAQHQYLLMQLLTFFPIAMIGLGVLIIAYIGLAKSCGRYENIKELFSWNNIASGKRVGSMQTEMIQTEMIQMEEMSIQEMQIRGMQNKKTPWRWVFSLPLIISVVLCIYIIIMVEIQIGIS